MANEQGTAQPVITRAAKKDAAKQLIKDLLQKSPRKSNDLMDEAAKLYAEKFGGEETENVNDVKGRIGSLIDVMKKDGELEYADGMYALKSVVEEKPKRTKKAEKQTPVAEEEKAKKLTKRATKTTKAKAESTESAENVESAPQETAQPVAPAEKPKKRTKKSVAEKPQPPVENVEEVETKDAPIEDKEKKAEKTEQSESVEVAEITQRATPSVPVPAPVPAPAPMVMDMSFLFGGVKQEKKEKQAKTEKTERQEKQEERKPALAPVPVEERAAAKQEGKPAVKQAVKPQATNRPQKQTKAQNGQNTASKTRTAAKPKTADEKLQEAFLNRLYKLGGDYFEYYSVYLLEKYSRKNGRRLESLKVSGGDRDGGIDGEIELTDTLGFRETIYIQAKNWNPEKGDERLWTVGETLIQQFIGACVYRQTKDGKQRCRGIFITTSRFTPEAKRMLEDTADSFVGYDGTDLYETAKECSFGIIKKNGEWVLDEELLSGEQALFHIL